MRLATKWLVIFGLGFAVAQVAIASLGVMAAISWDRETYRYVASNQVLAFLVLSLAMAALPVAVVASLVGMVAARLVGFQGPIAIGVASLPWAIMFLWPAADGASFWAWAASRLADPHTVLLLLAVPAGLLLGSTRHGVKRP